MAVIPNKCNLIINRSRNNKPLLINLKNIAINIPNDTIIVTPRDPNPIFDPLYTGVTGTLDPGTITVINFGDPTVNPVTGGGTTGVITPVLTSGYVDIKTGIDPCNQPIILGRMINTVTTTGTTDTFAPYFNAVSSNVFDLSNITGYTANVVYKNAVVKPGYTIYFKDVYGNSNSGGQIEIAGYGFSGNPLAYGKLVGRLGVCRVYRRYLSDREIKINFGVEKNRFGY